MLPSLLVSLLLSLFSAHTSFQTDSFRCMPCGQDCDNTVYSKPGNCGACHMELVKASGISFRNMPASMVCAYIKTHPDMVLLDVRTREEYSGKANPDYGTLINAINIPIQELETRIGELDAYRKKEILVFCSHSHRSPRASYLLTQKGFTVINMSGGMSVFNGPCKK
ncbi:rhodanese-like domain-containing protein [Sediminibacterium soli]|uniref:rhodanese-like domain-containing protein n=1 Tax=Sediminibacterium soli TaxID=2698829 RepID=UPI00137AC256|nr:rhodanese-like domain-containing protein [Sediminibacterium soli]NCI47874.1 rhodanese-like domain-containing protein [Sediminibacterium soli]